MGEWGYIRRYVFCRWFHQRRWIVVVRVGVIVIRWLPPRRRPICVWPIGWEREREQDRGSSTVVVGCSAQSALECLVILSFSHLFILSISICIVRSLSLSFHFIRDLLRPFIFIFSTLFSLSGQPECFTLLLLLSSGTVSIAAVLLLQLCKCTSSTSTFISISATALTHKSASELGLNWNGMEWGESKLRICCQKF